MAKERLSKNGIVPIPKNCSVTKQGYVLYNLTTYWTDSVDGSHKYGDHEKLLIGKIVGDRDNWQTERRMYPNDNYFKQFKPEELPEYPEKSNNISVGLFTVVSCLTESIGLNTILCDVFGVINARLILDLACYMLSQESAVFQHYPHWARSNAIFSETISSDTTISEFLNDNISLSDINLFKEKWARHSIGNGKIYLCYDSTNVNSRATGVMLVQKGWAKDDKSLLQVNTDYVVRQEDGVPVTFTTFPGSITDIAEASETLKFFDNLLKDSAGAGDNGITGQNNASPDKPNLEITMVCDRGYISRDNVEDMDNAGIDFLLMLRKNMGICDKLIEQYGTQVQDSDNYLFDKHVQAMTVEASLFDEGSDNRYFHIVWDGNLQMLHRTNTYNEFQQKRNKLNNLVDRKTVITKDEAKNFNEWFELDLEANKTVTTKSKKEVEGFIIKSFKCKKEELNKSIAKCGFYILVTSKSMTADEAITSYRKRDCVEKVFYALKSFLGMNKYGVHSDNAYHSKALIWFIAAILHAYIFSKTKDLRLNERKNYTVPCIIDLLEEITADKNCNYSDPHRQQATVA